MISREAVNTNSSSSANTISVTSGSPQAGDLVIAIVHVNGTGTVTDNNGSTPFTQKATNTYNTASGRAEIWSRRAGASEPANYSFNNSATDRISCTIIVYRGVHPFTPFDVDPVFNNGSGTTLTCTGITTLTDNAMIVGAGFIDTATVTLNTIPSGYSSVSDVGGQRHAVADYTKSTKGSQASGTFTVGTGNGWGTYHFALRNNYLKKHKISIDYTKVSGGANLSNYPALFGDSNFLAEAYANSQGKEINSNILLADANLKAYWRMENANDTTANAYNLTNVNTATFGTGLFSNAVDVNGSNQYLYTSNTALNFTGNFSYVARFKLDSYPTGTNQGKVVFERIASNSVEGMGIYVGDANTEGNRIYGLAWASTGGTLKIDSGIKPMLDIWYTVVFVKAAANDWKLYVNGVLTVSSTSSRTISATNKAGICIGAADQGSSGILNYFDGKIDDVAIFDRALTATEANYLHTGGHDLRFTSDLAGTTRLPVEIVDWDIVNSKAQIYTKVPTVSYTANTDLYVWYDDDLATPVAKNDTYGSDNAWDSNYKGVWHFENHFFDSTSNGNNWTPVNGVTFTTGKVGRGIDLEDSSSQYLTLPNDTFATIDPLTVTLYYKPEATPPVLHTIFGLCDSSTGYDYRILLFIDSSNKLVWKFSEANATEHGYQSTSAEVSAGNMYQLGGTIDFGSGQSTMKSYKNGAEVTNTRVWGTAAGLDATPTSTTIAPRIGSLRSGNAEAYHADGVIDEVRISSSIRTTGWIATEYANINDPSTFSTPIALLLTLTLTETATISESFLKAITTQRLESVTSSEAFTKLTDKLLTGVLFMTNNSTVTFLTNKVLVETPTISEVFTKIGTFFKTFTDTSTITETFTKTFINLIDFVDSVSVTETFTAIRARVKEFTETVTSSEVFTKAISTVKSELAEISEEFEALKAFFINLTDSATITEVFTKLWTKGLSFVENATITENFVKGLTLFSTLTDSTTITDSITKLKTQFKVLTDTSTITDTLTKAVSKVLTDLNTISESFVRRLNGVVIRWEKIGRATGTVWTKFTRSASSIWTKITKPDV